MHKFDPRNAHKLLSEERKRVLPAYEILRSSGLMDGMVFADIGCGNGYFTLPALEIVGEKGKVYSIDVQKEMLDELKKICHKENVA
ncbi:MAG: methyltransferase domain-containing protein, partial [Candidatus Pacearchaeota archaeon]